MTPDTRPNPPARTPSAAIGLVVAGCVGAAALSLVLVPSTITFDPLTWATWAREIAHLNLDTRGGPAWKPLPVVVDVLAAPLGQAEKWVWLVVARAGAALGVVMAYRLARRLVLAPRNAGAGPGAGTDTSPTANPGPAATLAGLVAAAGVALSASYLEYLAPLGMSEPLMGGLALLALERHFDGKFAQCYGLVYACLLLRPETFPFFVGYSIFLWLRYPRSRPWVVLLFALLPVLWLAPDYAGSGDWLRSTKRAAVPSQGGPLLTAFPAWAVIESAYNAVVLPVVAGAAAAVAIAVHGLVRRRPDPMLLAVAGICVGWVVEEALVTQAHFGSGDQRYLIVGYALACVLAGVGWVRVVEIAVARLGDTAQAAGAARAAVAVSAVAALAAAPFVWQRVDELTASIGEVPYQAHKYGELEALIRRAGGAGRVRACGPLTADIYQMPAIAWDLGVHQHQIVIGVRPTGTVFRTRTTRGSPLLPPQPGSPAYRLVGSSAQWQLSTTCPG